MAPDIVDEEGRGETEFIQSRSMHQVHSNKRNLREESEREKTYTNWPVRFLDSKSLAKQGFYYTNIDDVVKCAFCGIEIGCWDEGDDPEKDHKRLSPKCPILSRSQVQADGRRRGQDVCGPYDMEIRPFSGPERLPPTCQLNTILRDLEQLELSRRKVPVSPNYSTYTARLKTFEKWTKSEIQSPEKLAEAGFYYTSLEDNVLCFYCGGGLKNWEVEDEPWVQHAIWFPRCPFILFCKGKEFVKEVLARPEKIKETPSDSSSEEEKKKKEKEVPSLRSSITSPSKAEKKKEPNSEGKDKYLCRICYTRERKILFQPCRHLVSCPECAACLSSCAVCRKPIEDFYPIYLS